MTRHHLLLGAAFALAAAAPLAQAADPAAGQAHYESTCVACHGPGGISVAPIYPNLAGQKEPYLVEQIKAYRDGSRVNAIMAPMAKNLTDTQIVNLAAYLSALKPR
ncbi:MAG TPA: cytochrome c [Ottowia sp.]|uniref:c-type cytochrome n=1 Tax=Ottowia sp. TaxID=1898956 RepID=UPI002CC7247F|nr:cytochrome c [Ottowia sp.]HMN21971.1 cytochrome c [Ottowia sp.]